MQLNKLRVIFVLLLINVIGFSGCEILMLRNWNDTRSLEEYGNDVSADIIKLVPYIGKSKVDVRMVFGEPSEIQNESGMVPKYFQLEKVSFDEIWDYSQMKGIPMVNAVSGSIWFYFKDGIVVAVDAF